MDLTFFWVSTFMCLTYLDAKHVEERAATTGPSEWRQQAQATLKSRLSVPLNTNVAKNVIMFLGDGMGISTITGIRIYKGQKMGNTGEETVLNMDSLPHSALSKTYNVDRQVPDSAATATAFLCGVKANYGTVGIDETVKRFQCEGLEQAKAPSIAKWSQDEGKSTGIVTTTRVTHATPAVTYAHAGDRYWEHDKPATGACKDIARQLIEDDVGQNLKVVLGGGRRYFTPKTMQDPVVNGSYGLRNDSRNLIEEWKAQKSNQSLKHQYVWTKEQLEQVDPSNVDYLLGLFDVNHLKYELDRQEKDDQPSIMNMTKTALDILKKNSKGYFLLVEGGRIDHGHHDGWAKRALADGAAFDDAIGYALDNTDQSDTLILVTADHSHTFTIGGYPSRGNNLFGFNDYTHSDTNATDGNLPYTTLGYANGPGAAYNLNATTGKRIDLTNVDTSNKEYKQAATIPTNSESHGGEDVAILARGPMAHLFSGVVEQNYIAHAMAYASCVGDNKDHCNTPPPTTPKSNASDKARITLSSLIVLLFISSLVL